MTAPVKKSRPMPIALRSATATVAVLPLLAAVLAAQPAGRAAGISVAVRTGDSAWTGGSYAVARDAYTRVLAIDSTASSRSVYRLAVMRTWDGDLHGALPLFSLYVRLEPRDEEGRIALAKALAWSGNTANAVAIYDSILSRDLTYRDAALGAAQALTYAGKLNDALARYDGWLKQHPRDIEAGLARARTLAWRGKLKESERAYASLGTGGEHLEAEKGVALVAAWRGNLGRSERLWKALSQKAPKDAEIWTGLAQVQRWQGRSEEARVSLRKALDANPGSPDAREQLRWVKAELGTVMSPTALATWDSDRNQSVLVGVSASVRPLTRTRLTVSGSYRDARLNANKGTSAGGMASLLLHAGTRLSLTGAVGATRTRAGGGSTAVDRDFLVGGGRATLMITPGFTLGGGVSHYAFEETAALIASGVTVTSYSGETELRLPARFSLSAGGEHAELEGGSGPNVRNAGFGAVRWRASRQASFALSGRGFRYAEQLRDGYFAPSQFLLGEFSTRLSAGGDLGWAGQLEGAVGLQDVEFNDPGVTRGTQRVGALLAYRPRPGAELALEYAFSNVASNTGSVAGGGSVYHAHTVSFRTRLTW